MKQKKLMPQIVAPINRRHWEKGSTMVMNAINSSEYCDLATRQCYPFAGDNAN